MNRQSARERTIVATSRVDRPVSGFPTTADLLREERERLASEMFAPVVMRLSRATLDAHALFVHLDDEESRQRLGGIVAAIDEATRALRRALFTPRADR
jgi:hypothetical protein